jgi:ribosomal protein S7
LNLEINLLKKKINELSEERNLEEKLNLKKEIVESLINIFPYGSKAISAFKIIKNTVKLIDYKIEQEKIIDQ